MKHTLTAWAAGLACANTGCTNTIERRTRGRQKRFCSRDCQEAALKSRTVRTHGRRNEVRKPQGSTSTDPGYFTESFSTETTACKGENGDLQKASLRWIEVNPATFKLTDGVMERTPACHGKWGGFNIERGIAWVIETGWPFGKSKWWYSRCGDKSYGPTDFETAKRAAIAFVTGAELPNEVRARVFGGPVDLKTDPQRIAELRKAALRDGREA
jgi:hypothetical protein